MLQSFHCHCKCIESSCMLCPAPLQCAAGMHKTRVCHAGGTWAGVVRECILGALATKLIAADTQIVSIYHRC